MHKLAVALVIMALTAAVSAHPGNGIVVAKDGTVYFADVGRETIWKLDPAGKLTPLVRNRWTHSLFLVDARGEQPETLYYEREGPGEGVAPCSFWSITSDGTHTQLIKPQRDRRSFAGGAFVVDVNGNVYYAHNVRDAENKWRTRIMRRTPAGEVTAFTGLGTGPLYTDGAAEAATIRIVTAMAMGPNGNICFADRDHIRRVALDGEQAGRVTTIASGLIDEKPSDPPERRGPPTTINRLYGLAVDSAGNILVAYQAGRRVMRISAADGTSDVLRTSPEGWSPLGVTSRDGATYVLEVADGSLERLRVIRIGDDGTVRTLVAMKRGD